jgi:hypothetical protein
MMKKTRRWRSLEVMKRKKRRLIGRVLIVVVVANVLMMMAMMMGMKETRKRCPTVAMTGQRSLAWKAKVLVEVGRLFLGWLVLVWVPPGSYHA